MKHSSTRYIPERKIDFLDVGQRPQQGHLAFDLRQDLDFSTDRLESYAFSAWAPFIFDAMVVAAAIEFGDRVVKRPSHGWPRRISLRIPVHDPKLWNSTQVSTSLLDAIGFLTGDYWKISFIKRTTEAPSPRQSHLDFSFKSLAILAYSDGMDSLAAAGIVSKELGQGLIRVRVGSDQSKGKRNHKAFAAVPYNLVVAKRDKETSARNRGFKFAMISAIAAYLTGADEIVIPESGQGAIGTALIPVGHAYPDYRNHPQFTKKMELFVTALFGRRIQYVFPRLWYTKGETLRDYVSITGSSDWELTKSCWRSSQWSSVDGQRRQCGVCAACMLRRLSVHSAGLTEDPETYICTDMSAPTLEEAVAHGFSKYEGSFNEYAIAGVLHLDHLADMAKEEAGPTVRRHARLISSALGLTPDDVSAKLSALLERHAQEWTNYLDTLGAHSFARKWARTGQ